MSDDELHVLDDSVQLFTMSSPSHSEMCDRFVLGTYKLAGFDKCTVFRTPQLCETGIYNSAGFSEQMLLKLDALASIPIGTKICYVDADCLLFPGLRIWCDEWLAVHPDVVWFGHDVNQFCMGTLLYVQTADTIMWWTFLRLLAWMMECHDQNALNEMVRNAKRTPVSMDYLPNNIFANWATGGDLASKKWQGGPLVIPDSVLCWHANFCTGIDTKIRMLEQVQNTFYERAKT